MAKTQKEIDDVKNEDASLKTKLNGLNEDELEKVAGGSYNDSPEEYIGVGLECICDNYEDAPQFVPPFARNQCEGCAHIERVSNYGYIFYCCKHYKNVRKK